MSSLPSSGGPLQALLRLGTLVVLGLVGWLLIVDRPGLDTEYFALGAPWEGRVLATTVGEPKLESALEVRAVLMTKVGFSIRWSGWWYVAEAGDHRFALSANDKGYMRLDDEVVVDTGGVLGERSDGGAKALDRGFHRVEVGLEQRDGEAFLDVLWVAPGAAETVSRLPAGELYAGRPLALRRLLRGSFSAWPRPLRQLLGMSSLVAMLLLLARWAPRIEWPLARVPPSPRRRAALLLGLFVVVFLAVLPFTGFLLGGDDVMYLNAATFNTQEWFANRYGHVYLLKLFTALTGGDPLVGVRYWWSFVFAATVSALALAVRSVGSRLQPRTLVAAIFVLMAQTTVIGLIGTGFADYSSMMFVTVVVALYMHGLVADDGRSPPRHEWRSLAIGALSVAAIRSKEVAAVLLLLPVLFAFTREGVSWRRFARRLAYWMAGAAAAVVLLMTLDGLIVGDPFFTIAKGERFENIERMNFPEGRKARPNQDWMNTIWPARHADSDVSLRFLWLGVCAAALMAAARRRRVELRLLHLLPIAYLGALVVLYVRLPHPFSPRMLITIAPVASLMTALMLHYAGLDELTWKDLCSPAALIPGGLFAGIVCFVVVPYRLATLPAADFLPVDWLRRFGWSPDHFLLGVAVPVVFLSAVGAFSLGFGKPEVRVVALAVAFLAMFGTGFAISWTSLAQHRSLQLGELRAYPWRVFREEIDDVPSANVRLSRDLHSRYEMTAQARSSLARLSLDRRDVSVQLTGDFPPDADLAIASRDYWRRWRRQAGPLEPLLSASARWDPRGLIVLCRPKEAALQAEILEWLGSTVAASREEGEGDRGGRQRLLRQLSGGEAIQLRRVRGTDLQAIDLYGDGWTMGDRPAGLVVVNTSKKPLAVAFDLSVEAPRSEYPVKVFVDEGAGVETVVFERSGKRRIDLETTEPRTTRLVVVWTDKGWRAPGADERLLGVRVEAPTDS